MSHYYEKIWPQLFYFVCTAARAVVVPFTKRIPVYNIQLDFSFTNIPLLVRCNDCVDVPLGPVFLSHIHTLSQCWQIVALQTWQPHAASLHRRQTPWHRSGFGCRGQPVAVCGAVTVAVATAAIFGIWEETHHKRGESKKRKQRAIEKPSRLAALKNGCSGFTRTHPSESFRWTR